MSVLTVRDVSRVSVLNRAAGWRSNLLLVRYSCGTKSVDPDHGVVEVLGLIEVFVVIHSGELIDLLHTRVLRVTGPCRVQKPPWSVSSLRRGVGRVTCDQITASTRGTGDLCDGTRLPS